MQIFYGNNSSKPIKIVPNNQFNQKDQNDMNQTTIVMKLIFIEKSYKFDTI